MNLTSREGGIVLSWVEGEGESSRIRFARFGSDGRFGPAGEFRPPRALVVHEVDPPSVVAASENGLAMSWIERGDAGVDLMTARSQDGGATWETPIQLNRASNAEERGFLSWVGTGDAELSAVWLDGSPAGTRLVLSTWTSAGPAVERVLDPRVCECCRTSAVNAFDGPVVVYRDRSPDETRDIGVVRATTAGEWSAPQTVSSDGWIIAGCPVNGPALDAASEELTTAWFTAGENGEKPQVRVAMSADGGRTFGKALRIDDGEPVGRAAVAQLARGKAAIAWIEKDAIRLRHVRSRNAGVSVAAARLAPDALRAVPRLVRIGEELLLAWSDGAAGVKVLKLPAQRDSFGGGEVGDAALDIAGLDLDGKPVRLADYRGKVVLLSFGGLWCPGCVKEMPSLVKMRAALHARGFEVLSIDKGDSLADLRQYAAKEEIQHPILTEVGEDVMADYSVRGVPLNIVVDREGKIRFRAIGYDPFFTTREIRRAVEQALGPPPGK